MKVSEFREGDRQRWDDFVLKNSFVRFYHLSGFKDVLEKFYRDRSFYLIFENDDEIKAVLPIFLLKTLFFHKALSLPFAEYAGIMGENLSSSEMEFIVNYLKGFLLEHDVPYLEINAGLGMPQDFMQTNFKHSIFGQYAELELTSIHDLWENSLDYQVKKAIRKSEKSGLDLIEDTTIASLSGNFYPLYLKSMKRMGSPPLPLKFFLDCYNSLQKYLKIFFVKDGKRITTALQGYVTNKRVFIQHIVSEVDNFEKRPVDFLHWAFIKWACENGCKFFDFGMSRYEGQRRFKAKWGVKFNDYSFYYLFKPGVNIAVPSPLTPLSDRMVFLTKAWRIAMPEIVGNFIGPFIRAQLGK
ncbi:MAG: GNAT family N-acetyltransferase [Candidatus Omnitrophota bacterium]